MRKFFEKHGKQYDIGIAVVMLLTFLLYRKDRLPALF